jgi:hypothetical protein
VQLSFYAVELSSSYKIFGCSVVVINSLSCLYNLSTQRNCISFYKLPKAILMDVPNLVNASPNQDFDLILDDTFLFDDSNDQDVIDILSTTPSSSRFVHVDDHQLQQMCTNDIPKSTFRKQQWCVRLFNSWLHEWQCELNTNVQLKRDEKNTEYIEYVEQFSKNKKFGLEQAKSEPKVVRIFQSSDLNKCVVELYKKYVSHRYGFIR